MTLVLSQTLIDAGVVQGRAEFGVTLTNSGGVPVTVDEVEIPEHLDGLLISGDQPPFVLAAGGQKSFTLVATRTGRRVFSGTWTFRTSTSDASVTLSGERRATWPFAPNWSGGWTLKLAFKTDIFPARSGRERRIAVRKQPRRTVTWNSLVANDDARRAETLLQGLSGHLAVADPTRRAALAEISGASSIVLTETQDWAVTDGFIQVGPEVVQVASVDGPTCALTRDLLATYPAGTKVRPVFLGQVENQRISNHTDRHKSFRLTLNEEPGLSDPEGEGVSDETFAGEEVYPVRANWRQVPQGEIRWLRDILDHQSGVRGMINHRAYPDQMLRVLHTLQGADIFKLVRFFSRMKGRQKAFYCATGLSDVALRAGAEAPAANQIRVVGTDVYSWLKDDVRIRAIEARLPGGSVERVAISGMTIVSDASGDDTVLTLSSNWAVAPSSWTKLSWLHLCRFAGDELTLNFKTDTLAEAQVTIQMVEI